MDNHPTDALVATVTHYLNRTEYLLKRLKAEKESRFLLRVRLAPDMFDTGLNFALAIQFAARAVCPPAGRDIPEIPAERTVPILLDYKAEIARLVGSVRTADLTDLVAHRAGAADLVQEPTDYIARFALPNMIFHLSLAYAALRHGGMQIGKADFDGLHAY